MAFLLSSSRGDPFAAECLQAINDHRSRHQVPPLRLNPQISKISQNWADQLARSNNFGHNQSAIYNNNDLGENIAMKWSSDRRQFPGKEIVDMWYNEIKDYNFRTHSGPKTGHFTQLVWKASAEVGIGKAVSPDGKFLVVANFNPPGNFIGKFAENVFPPRDGKVVQESGSRQQPKATTTAAKSTPAEDSIHSRATPAYFPQPVSQPPSRGQSNLIAVRQSTPSGPSVTSSPNFGLLSGSNFTRRQVVQETLGHGAGAVTKTVVIETVQNPDGSTKTIQKESFSSRDQPQPTSGFEEFDRKFGFFRIGKNDGATSNVTQVSSHTVSDKKFGPSYNVSASSNPWAAAEKEKTWFSTGPSTSSHSPSSSTTGQSMKEFTDDIIRSHNKYRRKHGQVGDVRLNKDLSEIAQRWAERLASSGSMQHSQNKFQGLPLGENLACKFGSEKVDYRGEDVVNDWYAEIKDYNFRNSDHSTLMSTGHFTQVVWKGSRELGVGKASSRDGRSVFVVCNYFPAGNVIGKFRENVLPA